MEYIKGDEIANRIINEMVKLAEEKTGKKMEEDIYCTIRVGKNDHNRMSVSKDGLCLYIGVGFRTLHFIPIHPEFADCGTNSLLINIDWADGFPKPEQIMEEALSVMRELSLHGKVWQEDDDEEEE